MKLSEGFPKVKLRKALAPFSTLTPCRIPGLLSFPPMDEKLPKQALTARGEALDILLQIEGGAFSDRLLESLESGPLSLKDRSLVREIVLGTLRWRRRIDAVLTTYLTQPLDRLPSATLALLRLSTYQLRHLDRVPAYAVVSEAVELAHQHDPHRAKVVNAVLRGIADHRKGETGVDPSPTGSKQLALAQSFPHWLVDRWVARFGVDRTRVALEAMNARQPLTIRIRSTGNAIDHVIHQLTREGFAPSPHDRVPDLLYIAQPAGLFDTQCYRDGGFIAQGPAAAQIIDFAAIDSGHSVLDVCAAPGGKTCVAADRAGTTGTVVAVDRSPDRLRRLVSNVTRLELNVLIAAADGNNLPFANRFDRVIVDAPCSGFGTIGKHPEIKWHRTVKDLENLPGFQSSILDSAAKHVKVGGILLYSTCTTEPEENEHVIRNFLSRHEEFQIIPTSDQDFLRLLPERPGDDGGFAAKMTRIG